MKAAENDWAEDRLGVRNSRQQGLDPREPLYGSGALGPVCDC